MNLTGYGKWNGSATENKEIDEVFRVDVTEVLQVWSTWLKLGIARPLQLNAEGRYD